MNNKIKLISENDNSTVLAEYTGLNKVATSFQSEDALERELIKTLVDQGYERLNINSENELILNLRMQIEKLNNYNFTDGEWDSFFTKVIANKNDYIIEKTRLIQEDYKQEITLDSGEKKNIYLIDKNNIHNNSLQVLNQYVNKAGNFVNRYDVTILVNGLPLIHIELKKRGINLREAFNQIERYQRDSFWSGSGLYNFVQIFVISNGTLTKYYSNTWEDELLGLEREPSEKLIQAVGGAVVSNAVFPLVKITGKKVFNFATDNIFVKGKTINGDILEPIVFNNYRKELGEVTAIDLSHRDFKIADSIKKEIIKSQPIEEGMQRVFPKQEIKNNIIRERTGVEPGIIDFTKGREELLDIGNILKKKGIEIQAKSKKEINLSEAIRKSNRNMDKMALDWVDRYVSAPYIVTKDGYQIETLKAMRDIHPMFYDTLGMSFKGQGYNDVLGEALEDKSVVKSVLFQMSKRGQTPFLIKDIDDPNWNIKKLDNFSYKKNNNFRRAIENGITYNTLENEALLKTSPKYNKYLSNTNNIESFAKEVADVFNDYKNKKLKYDEVVAVLEAKRAKYETIAITKPNGGEMSYKEFLNIGSKVTRNKNFNIDKLVNDEEAIKQKKVDTAIKK